MSTQKILGSADNVTTSIREDYGDRDAKIVEIEGTFEHLQRSRSSLVFSECPSGYTIESNTLSSTGDGMGKLTLRCVKYQPNGAEGFEATRTTMRVDMQEVQYDLEDHPYLEDVRKTCLLWLSTDNDTRYEKKQDGTKKYYYTNKSGTKVEITDAVAKKFCEAYMSGIKSFVRYYPVIEKITTWNNPPGMNNSGRSFKSGSPRFSDNVGKFDTPPLTLNGWANANYFKSKDSWSQNQNTSWTRVEQWTWAPDGSTGPHAWIYTESAPPSPAAN